MGTGVDLLLQARSGGAGSWPSMFGPEAAGSVDSVDRPAIVATLLTERNVGDLDLLRVVTTYEIAARKMSDDGCGDVLLACCWMLFCDGRLEDVPLIWRAKNINFDAYCYIDAAVLLPQGLDASMAVAAQAGADDLLVYLRKLLPGDMAEEITGWRTSPFFAACPAPTSGIVDLAGWLRDG
ncbi:hypothetical protein ABTZ46_01865 [Nocardioides sp. NPDC126508]